MTTDKEGCVANIYICKVGLVSLAQVFPTQYLKFKLTLFSITPDIYQKVTPPGLFLNVDDCAGNS